MNIGKMLLIVLAIVLIVSTVSVWFVPSLQDYMIGNTLWNGLSNSIEKIGGEIIYGNLESTDDPEDTVIFFIPSSDFDEVKFEYLEHYVNDGGTLIISDDYGFGNKLLGLFGLSLRFSGLPLLDPLFCYKDPWLPKITDFSPEIAAQGVGLVVLNHATAIEGADEKSVLAWSSATSFLDSNQNGKQDTGEIPVRYPVATSVQFGRGSIMMVSDSSLLINSMITRYDNEQFVKALTNLVPYTEKKVFVDISLLPETLLDTSKRRLEAVKNYLAEPYPLLAILGSVFILISVTLGKVGGKIGRKS